MNSSPSGNFAQWPCDHCTMLNSEAVVVCGACSKTREGITSRPLAGDELGATGGGGDDVPELPLETKELGNARPDLLQMVQKLQGLFEALNAAGGFARLNRNPLEEAEEVPVVEAEEVVEAVVDDVVPGLATPSNDEADDDDDDDDVWQCNFCTLLNPLRARACLACAHSRQPFHDATEEQEEVTVIREWQCRRCPYMNSAAAARCETCNAPHNGGIGSADDDEDDEPLPNPIAEIPLVFQDDVINVLEEVVGGGDDANGDQWQCQHCTLLNEPDATACAVCCKSNPAALAARRPPAAATARLNEDGRWQCSNCTLINNEALPECEACGTAIDENAMNAMLIERQLEDLVWFDDGDDGDREAADDRLFPLDDDEEGLDDDDSDGDEGGLRPNEGDDFAGAGDDALSMEDKIIVDRLLTGRLVPSYEKAQIVLTLLRLDHPEDVAVEVANIVDSADAAIEFFRRCPICDDIRPTNKMLTMLHCGHEICHECATGYFTTNINEGSLLKLTCFIYRCHLPDLTNKQTFEEYFNYLAIQVRNLITEETRVKFENKLRDHALNNDPSFCWCGKCQNGVFIEPGARMVRCPHCGYELCGQCKVPWEVQHEGIDCQKFAEWKRDNDKDNQEARIDSFLKSKGIVCPACKAKFELTKGGCMHMTCTSCSYQFCVGCRNEFVHKNCKFLNCQPGKGLHAHHPRHCPFYLRDFLKEKNSVELKDLLKKSNVAIDQPVDPVPVAAASNGCQILEQKDMPDGTKQDVICGQPLGADCDGLCRTHFEEKLAGLFCMNDVDPVSIMDCTELEMELVRNGQNVPTRISGLNDAAYKKLLEQAVVKDVPLKPIKV